MNRANLYDSTNPGFVLPPTDTIAIQQFLERKWWSGGAAYHWPWKPENSLNQLWPLEENLAYTNNILQTAGMGGFPLGDLYHWWNPSIRPGVTDYYTAWKANKSNEDKRIEIWLITGEDPGVVGVKELSVGNIPAEFSLEQNYPNPFNPTTQIKYSVPKNSLISMKVYDVLGREIATLLEGIRQPGSYEVTFDGSKLTSGVYFYKLQTTKFTSIKKMLLLK